jgi:hypothetical protein
MNIPPSGFLLGEAFQQRQLFSEGRLLPKNRAVQWIASTIGPLGISRSDNQIDTNERSVRSPNLRKVLCAYLVIGVVLNTL